ncbi:MAG: hypothetical protein Q9159_002310 [Coniocarpon cinnabarinum]
MSTAPVRQLRQEATLVFLALLFFVTLLTSTAHTESQSNFIKRGPNPEAYADANPAAFNALDVLNAALDDYYELTHPPAPPAPPPAPAPAPPPPRPPPPPAPAPAPPPHPPPAPAPAPLPHPPPARPPHPPPAPAPAPPPAAGKAGYTFSMPAPH